MVAALEREMPDATFEVPQGGYYVWVTLPDDVDGDRLARSASECGVTVLAGQQVLRESRDAIPEEPSAHRLQSRDA